MACCLRWRAWRPLSAMTAADEAVPSKRWNDAGWNHSVRTCSPDMTLSIDAKSVATTTSRMP